MSDSNNNDQQNLTPPPPLEEGRPINYNITVNKYYIDGDLVKTETGDITMTDESKHETTQTTVNAEKIDRSAIGKENKTTNITFDGLKIVLIVLSITISLLLIIAITVYIATNGEVNVFPILQNALDSLLSNSN
jgi:hypothetical protein